MQILPYPNSINSGPSSLKSEVVTINSKSFSSSYLWEWQSLRIEKLASPRGARVCSRRHMNLQFFAMLKSPLSLFPLKAKSMNLLLLGIILISRLSIPIFPPNFVLSVFKGLMITLQSLLVSDNFKYINSSNPPLRLLVIQNIPNFSSNQLVRVSSINTYKIQFLEKSLCLHSE